MKHFQRYALLIVSLLLLPMAAKADIGPIEAMPFDGECLCEVQCNGEVLRYFQIEYVTKTQVGSTSQEAANKACADAGDLKRGLKSLKADITAKGATARFCRLGGDKAEACTVDGACAEEKVSCRTKSSVSEGEG